MMTSLKECQRWAEKLAARHPDDCSADEQRALDEHVVSCPDCATRRAQYAALSQRIHAAVASDQAQHEPIFSAASLEHIPAFSYTPVRTVEAWRRRRQPIHIRPTFAQSFMLAVFLLLLAAGSVFSLYWQFGNRSTVVGSSKPAVDTSSLYFVAQKPTLNVATINLILKEHHSPLENQGQFIYDQGLAYKVDPAFILALALQDSNLGTVGEAMKTRSITSMRCYTDVACVDQNLGGYAQYRTWDDGVVAIYSLIRDYYINVRGLETIDAIIPTYAPRPDYNDDLTYIRSLERIISTWRAMPTNHTN